MLELVIELGVSIGIGTILLMLATKPIAGIQPSLGTAFWSSAIAHWLTWMVAIGPGFVLANHLVLALILGVIVQFYVQVVILQIAIRATGKTLVVRKAYILSVLMILADFFVVKPLMALGMKGLGQ